ncbi:methyltransferase domain-containing protein [Chitinophaga sp. OAE865]|uniref:class I SAM-dependent methyltransferase n=1 Tax=Chitinophaga sp. OAE865 TaxID=2817898 RepID=UPI001AE3A76C
MEINERFTWAADIIAPKPASVLLEIRCGAGLLAELIAGKLSTGSIMCIDQSASMIRMAIQRNKRYVLLQRASFEAIGFADAVLPENKFDKVFAFNVNFFWKQPAKELALISRCLRSKGELFVFYQTPGGTDMKLCKAIKARLEENGFRVSDTLFGKFSASAAFCIIAKPLLL